MKTICCRTAPQPAVTQLLQETNPQSHYVSYVVFRKNCDKPLEQWLIQQGALVNEAILLENYW